MVDRNQRWVQFGKGDVSMNLTIMGSNDNPQAVIAFTNRDPAELYKGITFLPKNADMSQTIKGSIKPFLEGITMSFSNPESIDCVVESLLAIKEAAFGKKSVLEAYLGEATH